jgi:transposase InsO family protein
VSIHRNAKLTPSGRALLVERIEHEDWLASDAAEAAGVSVRTAYKWLARYRGEGNEGLQDRSSRPHSSPSQTPASAVRQIERCRRRRKTAWEIAQELELAASTVSRVLKHQGLGRLWRVEEEADPPHRYEHPHPGSLIHIDAKKLGKIGKIGHRIHGDWRRRARGVGWEVFFVAVDDHSRLAYVEVLSNENAQCATAFFRRALRWFATRGVQVERVLSDNAKCYHAKAFQALCQERGVRQKFTKPYTPKTNGKAERFIQTTLRRWAYRRPYRTSAMRQAALPAWVKYYNHERPHRSLDMKPPMDRIRETGEQRA